MAKHLLLIRHGKSDWAEAGLTDFERPLNKRGKKNAPEMAQRLLDRKLIPELLVSSPAKRAHTTAKLFAAEFGIDKSQIQLIPEIYEAHYSNLLKVVNQLDNSADYVALFGHNPGFTELANYLSNADIYNIPTCGMVLISFPFKDWNMISSHTGNLEFFDYPKNSEEGSS